MNGTDAMRAGPCPDGKAGSHRIVAVVVTLNPDAAVFDALLTATRAQVERIVVVDNGSREESAREVARLCGTRAELHGLHKNLGVAAAQNRGIEWARATGATHVLLLDHDSVPDPDMVAALRVAAEELAARAVALGAVGPVIIDRQTQTAAPLPQIVDGAVRFVQAPPSQPTECEYLIASGSLIPMAVFDSVGPMDETYFVDQVDIEWCLRAQRSGFAMYCAPRARLNHMIGDEVVSFWLLRRRELAVHSPLRDYYYFRNSVRLIRSADVPTPWRRFWIRRLVRLFVLQSLFVAPRLARARAMLKGVTEGFLRT
ncbi:rhamnosyltransferase [Caballeronia turbans]|uniref:glycosyltransferase family 2 protein n=1 Tax=unclassified Caballeronia TaxID=2646786 RepID=UPI00074CAD50|nr:MULTISPECIES: glycosyltransferase family 2 protein [unclassified Caballeronia]SAL38891.1 rhamnosyltransferase [Caballeronia turbans]